MSAYTPGPWRLDGLAVSTQAGFIATIPAPRRLGVMACNENARLIAAAPDLLEALKEAFAELQEVLYSCDGGQAHFDGDRFHERFEMARAAIAKATGEQA